MQQTLWPLLQPRASWANIGKEPLLILPGNSLTLHPMSIENLFLTVREHYVQQLLEFIGEQHKLHKEGASEVKLQLGDESQLYNRLYCVDFLTGGEKQEVLELAPARSLSFDTITQHYGKADIFVHGMQWDAVRVQHDIAGLKDGAIAEWFEKWFDLDDVRFDQVAGTSNSIHSVLRSENTLSIDFGSSTSEALSELLESLEQLGARNIHVFDDRDEVE